MNKTQSVSIRVVRVGLVLLGLMTCSAFGEDSCGYRWSDRFATYDTGGNPTAIQVFDEDGSGPKLPAFFIAGSFSDLRSHPAPPLPGTRGIARWDGTRWTSVGGGAPAYIGTIYTMTVCDEDGDGPEPPALYVAPTQTGGCAKWDGSTWANCPFTGIAPGYTIQHLTTFDEDGDGPLPPSLIAAAWCTPPPCYFGRVYRLTADGSWTQLGGVFNDYLFDLETFDPDGAGPMPPRLIVAGGFDSVTPPLTDVNNVAQWDGSSWQRLGPGTNLHVYDLLACDLDEDGPQPTQLFAAGLFTSAGNQPANHIARWDGSTWSPLGSGMDEKVDQMAYFKASDAKGYLYALGRFRYAGGQDVWNGFAKWDGDNWARAHYPGFNEVQFSGFTGGSITLAQEFDPDGPGPLASQLYIGGTILLPPSPSAPPRNMGAWDGQRWNYLASSISNQSVTEQLLVHDLDGSGPDGPSLVAAGYFQTAGDSNARGLASWRDNDWTPIELGADFTINSINAVGLWDSDGPGPNPTGLVVLGDLYSVSYPIRYCTYWNGDAWQPVVNSFEEDELINEARFVVSWDHDGDSSTTDYLIVGGNCSSYFFKGISIAAAWTGTEWNPLGFVYECARANTILPIDRDGDGGQPPVLFVGASGPIFQDFDTGEFLDYLGWWDGKRWQPLGLPPNEEVFSLLYDDPDGAGPGQGTLYVGGRFTEIGGITANRVAAYDFDTAAWRAMGSIGDHDFNAVNALAILDEDGDGPLSAYLVAGGWFSIADGKPAMSIAKWDGAAWSEMDIGIRDTETSAGTVRSLAVLPATPADPYPRLFVGGSMERAGNHASRGIACWTKAKPVEVLMHPEDATVPAGTKVVLRASALGDDPITYQWRRDGVALTDDGRITGSDKAILRIHNVDRMDEGIYDVVATNNCSEHISQPAQLLIPCLSNRPDGDLNGDDVLDGKDIQLLVDSLLADTQTAAVVCRVDFDNSRRLDVADIPLFADKLLAP